MSVIFAIILHSCVLYFCVFFFVFFYCFSIVKVVVSFRRDTLQILI